MDVSTPFVKLTAAAPDALGNFRSAFLSADEDRIEVELDRTCIIIEGHEGAPALRSAVIEPGNLYGITRLDHLGEQVSSYQRCHSTYDRSGGNDDGFSGTTSHLYRKSSGEYVIFDAFGPGVIQRIWLTRMDKISRLRFYFDDQEHPGIDVTPDEMFEGKKPPFKYPLVAKGESAGGGAVSFVPIWFPKRLVIAAVGPPRFCQVDYSLVDSSAEIERSTYQYLVKQSEMLSGLAEYFTRETTKTHAECPQPTFEKEIKLPPGDKAEVAKLRGPGVIRCLRVSCAKPSDMKSVILQIHWDESDVAGVGSPLADIFGQKYEMRHWAGHAVGYMGGEGYIHYPMPFSESARIVLTNTGTFTAKVTVSIAMTRTSAPQTVTRYLCCHWKSAIAGADQGVRLLSVNGSGHFAGCILSMFSRGGLSYLDSDIIVFADDMTKPVVHSTGIDDYFSAANFYEKGPFNLPSCGLLTKSEGTTSQYRFNVVDPVPFEKSFSFHVENLPPEASQTVISGALFWYSESPTGGDQP
jgi:hypothetical protein